jgi:phenylalanyl-tRNA synthetase alpha chain
MKTKLLYFTDAYQKTATAEVIDVITEGPQTAIILDQTLFYPQGGGQPADQGSISSPTSAFDVTHVSYNGGDVLHKGKLSGDLKKGDQVTLKIDWARRYQHMQQHTAGHIVDQAVKNVVMGANSIDGNHGIGKHMFVEFTTEIPVDAVSNIQAQVENIIAENFPITTEMVSYEDLVKRQVKLPPDLPKDKPLRIVQIGQYPLMPDGGTQLHSTGETWPITITQVVQKDGHWRVQYQVQQATGKQTKSVETSSQSGAPMTDHASLATLQEKIKDIQLQVATDTSADVRTKYLGKKGAFNQLAQVLRTVDPAARKEAGQLLNQLKIFLETEVAKKEAAQNNSGDQWVDLTLPGIAPKVGHMHPVSQAMEEITKIFEHIGFTRVRYPEVDWDWYPFTSLNMPLDHPARDEWETFFVQAAPHKEKGKMVLTPHTSNGQVHEMERLKSQPPIRMINIARCYRRQQDATHTQMFHQFEGLVVDKGINIQHLKGTLDYFAEQFYGPGTKSRIRPFHFQFTEPSFEVDFSCHICHGTGKVDGNKCKFCKSGWHEVGGAGMVHPNVLKSGGIDPDEYSGFAFGWGIERTYTLKEGLNIDDIRLLYSGDLRFLEQF